MRLFLRKCLAVSALVGAAIFLQVPAANADLVQQTAAAQKESAKTNSARESRFSETEQQLSEKLKVLKSQRLALEAETDALSDTFSDNEQTLASLEETLRLEAGSLGEVFGVVRQVGRELNSEQAGLPAAIGTPLASSLDTISDASALPSLAILQSFAQGLEKTLTNSAHIGQITLDVRDDNGAIAPEAVTRVGNVALLNDKGYLDWDASSQQANTLPQVHGVKPPQVQALNAGEMIALDPSRGEVIKRLADKPTLQQRIAQGGLVGGVIIALLCVGIAIALVRGAVMFRARAQMNAQLKVPRKPADNPLGRVLKVYYDEPDRALETLELRLLEAVMDEQEGFEKGLSMLKLLAALAPMLGLLGTVTGMIETFQVITEYGNGNPSIMAGGISTALITTVMGLVAAIPLLLAHNVLSSQADTLRGMLEKTGVSLIAEQAEMNHDIMPVGQAV